MEKHVIAWTGPAPFWENSLELASAATPGNGAATPPPGIRRPAILRFAADNFMDQFLGLLSTEPHRLAELTARPETWKGIGQAVTLEPTDRLFSRALQRRGLFNRRPKVNGHAPDGGATAGPLPLPLKLFQPAHQRYYLVTTCLVCQTPGLPDRRIDPAAEEKASYVIRRLLPRNSPVEDDLPATAPETWDEHAFVAQPDGTFAWEKMGDAERDRAVLARGEELQPLFPVHYTASDERDRRLLAGLIPVGRREVYVTALRGDNAGTGPRTGRLAPANGLVAGASPATARKIHFRAKVSEPWKALVDTAARFRDAADKSVKPDGMSTTAFAGKQAETLRLQRDQLQTSSWIILADFARFLAQYIPQVAEKLGVTAASAAGLDDAQRKLLTALQAVQIGTTNLQGKLTAGIGSPATVASSLADALDRFQFDRTTLQSTVAGQMDATTNPYLRSNATNADWPQFLFPLADPEHPDESALPGVTLDPAQKPEEDPEIPTNDAVSPTAAKAAIDRLAALVLRALPAPEPASQPAVPLAAQLSAKDKVDLRPAWFVIRCVYERPRCGPLHDDVVSVRSDAFQMAAFFDPDAPARPIRIGLPVDTTPAGLAKFDKNTALIMSDVLCGQVQRAKGMSLADLVLSVLPWPFHKDLSLPDGGPCKKGGTNLGMICSISIPIVTICALILLIIMVSILDYIFRWLPFFIMCFPIPGLRAKPKPPAP
ncbi:MAG TPA: hypothetical protein VG734_12545 [Lacunisphaera sp.]|nr:hypothetical protein [Lacunisphaera sp.]